MLLRTQPSRPASNTSDQVGEGDARVEVSNVPEATVRRVPSAKTVPKHGEHGGPPVLLDQSSGAENLTDRQPRRAGLYGVAPLSFQ